MPKNNSEKIIVFVQARMGSTRLPGKVLKNIEGQPSLIRQVERIRRAKTVNEVVVITSTKKRDDAIARICEKNNIAYYRGSETDLLDRHYQAAKKFGADFVVKIGSDSPLIDPGVIDLVLNFWKKNRAKYDYVSNYHPPMYPDGLDVEGCPFEILQQAWREAKKPHEREHTFPFIWDHPERFRIGNVKNPLGNLFISQRWCLDYPEDLQFIRAVYKGLAHKKDFRMRDILNLLKQRPEIHKLNEKYLGVNWYRNVEGELKTVSRHLYKKTKPLKLSKSLALLKKAKQIIPLGTQTLSKNYTQWSVGASPLYLESGKGCEVTDVDGNVYIDYGMGLGPFILGYADDDVNAAVAKQLEKGTLFTLPHPLEITAAQKIIETVPAAEMVRFAKNGSDVTTAAVKLARAYTGKEKIIVCGYHGWHDWYIATTERNKGIPKVMKDLVYSMKYNDLGSLEKILKEHPGQIAGLIMEPVYVIEPKKGFLEGVRKLTREHGVVLIFDEMFSGYRWSMGGAQEYFNVIPDLACFGKAAANGMPVSILCGKREIMNEFKEVFFSFTAAGETLSLAALVATIDKLKREKVHEYVWKIGAKLKAGVQKLIKKHKLGSELGIIGYPVKSAFDFKGHRHAAPLEMKTYFQQECAKRGVLFIGYHLPSFAHKAEDIDFTLKVYDEVMGNFKKLLKASKLRKSLTGTVLTQIFRNVGDRSTGVNDKDA